MIDLHGVLGSGSVLCELGTPINFKDGSSRCK